MLGVGEGMINRGRPKIRRIDENNESNRIVFVNGAFVPEAFLLGGVILGALIPRIIRSRGIDPTKQRSHGTLIPRRIDP